MYLHCQHAFAQAQQVSSECLLSRMPSACTHQYCARPHACSLQIRQATHRSTRLAACQHFRFYHRSDTPCSGVSRRKRDTRRPDAMAIQQLNAPPATQDPDMLFAAIPDASRLPQGEIQLPGGVDKRRVRARIGRGGELLFVSWHCWLLILRRAGGCVCVWLECVMGCDCVISIEAASDEGLSA